MLWSAAERITFCCRYCLSRLYLRLIQLRGGTGLDPLFDRQFYLEHYPDVARSGVDPTTHFLLYGAREFRQPHPLFDTAYYLAANPDVAAAGLNPLLQFLQTGWREGRRPNPLFDPDWYAARYGLDKDVNPLLDYARRRATGESRLPRPPLREYLAASPGTDDMRPGARTDPAIFHRLAVSAARLKRCGRPVILAISHSLGGGVAEYLRRLNNTLLGQAEFLLLTPAGLFVTLESTNPEFAFSLAVDPKDDYEGLLEALRQCCVTRVHIQHVLGHVLDIHQLCNDLGVPFDFTVHDYLTICPQVHLDDVNGRYCGEPSEAGCNRCLSARPVYRSQSIGQWRREHAWLLRDAARVIAPSLDTELRMRKYSPGLRVIAAAHPEPGRSAQLRGSPPLGGSEPLRIVILGILSRQKGLALVRECARIAQHRRLPLEFTLIGHVGKVAASDPQPFRQTGPYDNPDLPDLLAAANPHLAWFPSQVPETHSFTLGSALYAGLPVAVPSLGAMPERLTGLTWAWVIPAGWDAKNMIAFFLAIREKNFIPQVAPQPPQGPTPVRHGFYEVEYLRPTKTAVFDSGPHGQDDRN
jgi:glycosyltransferase involved in cell wall biosynthesis